MRTQRRIERHMIRQAVEGRELKRRLFNLLREGRVVEHHSDNKRLLKVDVGPEGQPVITPWIEWAERAGAVKTFSRPSIGERVQVSSPDGELGHASKVVAAGFYSDNENPDGADGELLMTIGGSSFRFHADGLEIKGNFEVEGDVFTHNDTDVGHEHEHEDVESGTDLTGPPAG